MRMNITLKNNTCLCQEAYILKQQRVNISHTNLCVQQILIQLMLGSCGYIATAIVIQR